MQPATGRKQATSTWRVSGCEGVGFVVLCTIFAIVFGYTFGSSLQDNQAVARVYTRERLLKSRQEMDKRSAAAECTPCPKPEPAADCSSCPQPGPAAAPSPCPLHEPAAECTPCPKPEPAPAAPPSPEPEPAAAPSPLPSNTQQQQRKHGMAGRIPKILHHVYISNTDSKSMQDNHMTHHHRWLQNCKLHYSSAAGWTHMFWDKQACVQLVDQHFKDFSSFYRNNITMVVEKSDIIRYMIMYQYGGLYLDSDVDCWREAGDLLEGADVVLQGTYREEGAGNAYMASAPRVPAWLRALDMVQSPDRLVVRNVTYGQDDPRKSMKRTGPILLTELFQGVGIKQVDGLFVEESTIEGLVYRVYPVRTWFLPCQWYEPGCRRKVYQDLAIGQVDLRRVVGMHRFAGSWIPGKEKEQGIVNVTAELCNPQPDTFRRRLLV